MIYCIIATQGSFDDREFRIVKCFRSIEQAELYLLELNKIATREYNIWRNIWGKLDNSWYTMKSELDPAMRDGFYKTYYRIEKSEVV